MVRYFKNKYKKNGKNESLYRMVDGRVDFYIFCPTESSTPYWTPSVRFMGKELSMVIRFSEMKESDAMLWLL